MKAAAFGRAFDLSEAEEMMLGRSTGTSGGSLEMSSDAFVMRCNQLRIANALRSPDVAIPATIEQFVPSSPVME